MFGIERKADRVRVPVILKSLHVQCNSGSGGRRTVQESQIAQVLGHLNQESAQSAPAFAHVDVFGSQAERQFRTLQPPRPV